MADLNALKDQIKELTLLEASQLVKMLEEELGVSAAAASVAVAAAPAAAAKPDAKALYAGKCAMCHGADAKGGFGPNLTAKDYEYGKTRQAIFLSISQGRANNKMPAFEGQLKREEIYALADYLLTLK